MTRGRSTTCDCGLRLEWEEGRGGGVRGRGGVEDTFRSSHTSRGGGERSGQ